MVLNPWKKRRGRPSSYLNVWLLGIERAAKAQAEMVENRSDAPACGELLMLLLLLLLLLLL